MTKSPFGEFDATEPVKAGALSVAGKHRSSGLEVRLHFPPLERDELLDRALTRLRFNHPCMPKVLDFGSTTRRADELPGQTPYLVSQALIPLDDEALPKRWPALRDHLLQALECMSEAHAHNCFHGALSRRWMFRLPGDGRVQLCTEGWYLDGSAKVPAKLRPLMIAPEAANPDLLSPACLVQMDLYGLGYMAWSAACGSPPRPQMSDDALANFKPSFRIPSGFTQWTQTLLHCSPELRPRAAADALSHLLEVDRLKRSVPPKSVSREVPPNRPAELITGLSRDEMNTSLRLLGQRRLPMLGREELQDRLWADFNRVAIRKTSRFIVLRGGAGTGKSRLAEWLFRSIRRGGFADGLRVCHSQTNSTDSGLLGALRRYIQVDGLDPSEVLARCSAWLRRAGDDRLVIAKLLAALVSETGGMTPQQRQQAAQGIFARLSTQQPLMLWLEDLQWGRSTLEFLIPLLQNSEVKNLLIVATVRDEALLDRPNERALLDMLLKFPAVKAYDVAPLDDHAMRALTEELLHLAPSSALALRRRSKGNPLFAIQWVRHALSEEIASIGPEGIELSDKALKRLPDDALRLCMQSIESALRLIPEGQEEAALHGLTAAAVLGSPFRSEEWVSACTHLRVSDPKGLLKSAKESQILRLETGQLSFTHDLLGDALLFEASEKDYLTEVKAACGKALLDAFNGGRRNIAGRLFELLKDSGRVEEALPALLVAIDIAQTALDLDTAQQLLAEAEDICDQLNVPPEASLRLRLLNFQSELLGKEDKLNEALQLAEKVERDATGSDSAEIAARAALNAAHFMLRQGKLADALAGFTALISTNEELESPRHQAAAMIGAARVQESMGELTVASEMLRASLELLSDIDPGDMSTRASALRHLAAIDQSQGRFETARHDLAEAVRLENALGNQPALLTTMSYMGELCVLLGRDAKAKQLFREAASGLATLGSSLAIHPLMRLGYLAAKDKDLARAKDFVAEVEPMVDRSNSPRYEIMLLVLKAWVCGEERDWSAWDDLGIAIEEGFLAAPFFDVVFAFGLANVGLTAARRGEARRARGVFDLSLRILQQLGEFDERQRLQASFWKHDKT